MMPKSNMEQRKVYLSCGPVYLYPVAASVGLVITSFAVEVTTIVQFANIPNIYGPWLFHFPVQTANGHLVQCGILHNTPQHSPIVMFNEAQQTVVMGPCAPQQNILVFTMVSVYVPSFQQTFLAHLHLGSPLLPCVTSIKVRNLVTNNTQNMSVQLRSFNGDIISLLKPDDVDSEWLGTQILLKEHFNAKIHIFLMDHICFGVSEVYWGQEEKQTWVLIPEKNIGRKHSNLSLWVLKPRIHDVNFMRFYATTLPMAPKKKFEYEDLVVEAARIICKRDSFFQCVTCLTLYSEDEQNLSLLGEKVAALDLPDYRNPKITNPNLLDCISEKASWSWRTETPLTPHIFRMIAPLEL